MPDFTEFETVVEMAEYVVIDHRGEERQYHSTEAEAVQDAHEWAKRYKRPFAVMKSVHSTKNSVVHVFDASGTDRTEDEDYRQGLVEN